MMIGTAEVFLVINAIIIFGFVGLIFYIFYKVRKISKELEEIKVACGIKK